MLRIRFSVLAVAAPALAGALSMTALAQDLLTQKEIPMAVAQDMAMGAITQCRANGYRVTATVLDSGGNVKVLIRDDGSALATIDLSHRKAYAALIFKGSSADTVKAFGALTPAPIVEGTVMLAGGVPVKVGSDTIGAIGVSGAPGGEKDEACANAGLAKVAEKLK